MNKQIPPEETKFRRIVLTSFLLVCVVSLIYVIAGLARHDRNFLVKLADWGAYAFPYLGAVLAGGGFYFKRKGFDKRYFLASLFALVLGVFCYTMAHLAETELPVLILDIVLTLICSEWLRERVLNTDLRGWDGLAMVASTLGYLACFVFFYLLFSGLFSAVSMALKK